MYALKLIGAQRFSCIPLDIIAAEAGDIVQVETADDRDYLLAQTYRDKGNNDRPLFSTDLDAPVINQGPDLMPLEEALKQKPTLKRVEEKKGRVTKAKSKGRVRKSPAAA